MVVSSVALRLAENAALAALMVMLFSSCGPTFARLYQGTPLPTDRICLVGAAPDKIAGSFVSVTGSLTIDTIDGLPAARSNYYELLPGKHLVLSRYTSSTRSALHPNAQPMVGSADCPPLEFTCEPGKFYLIDFSYRSACAVSAVDASAYPKYQALLQKRTH